MPLDPNRVQTVFVAAVECRDRVARAALLDRECATDPELRQRVDALLRAHDHPESPLDQPIVSPGEYGVLPLSGAADIGSEGTRAESPIVASPESDRTIGLMPQTPTNVRSWIDLAAERFEWERHNRPGTRIEDFLANVAERQRPPLLNRLLRLERELRRRAGEETTAEEYRRRFPEHGDLVETVFGLDPSSSVTSPGSSLLGQSVPGAVAAARSTSPMPAELANHTDYEIVRELGRGGMGVVYLVHNRLMGRDEVLKVMRQETVELERFVREIRAVAKLRHPNIVSAYSAFRCGETLVFSMEYVEGLDLARMVSAKGPIPVRKACYFVYEAALGLQHAHEHGMVHRDIKPGNLMLSHKGDRPVIKLLDFGLARAASEQMMTDLEPGGSSLHPEAAENLTSPGQILGTPAFMAPEQIDDCQTADIRADIYSLGCTLYYLLSGRPPFQTASILETLQAHRSMVARPLNLVRPDVPAELADLVARMMAKEPDRRFETPSDVAKALGPFFKKPTSMRLHPKPEVGPDSAPDIGRGATGPAAETGQGMWSSLIDFRDTEDDANGVVSALDPAETGLRWLWPMAAAVVLLCGLFGAWAAGIFNGSLANKGAGVPAGAEANIEIGDAKPVRVSDEPIVESESSNTSPPVAGHSAETEATTATQEDVNSRAVFGDGASATFPVVAEPATGNGAPAPTSETTKPAQVFHETTSVKSPALVTQARLVSESSHVLFETGGRNRALWRGDLENPAQPRKLDASVPGWVHLAISSSGRFAVLAGTDNSLWYWDLQGGQSRRILRPARAIITAIALSPDQQFVAYVRDGAIQFCDAMRESAGKKKEFNRKIGELTDLIAFCPDGRRIVSTHADRSIRVWEMKTGREIGRVSETPKPVSGLAVFPDGSRVLISLSGLTFVWDLETNRQLRQAPGFGASIAVSADGSRALIGGGNFMRLWDLVTGDELVREDHKRAVLHVAFSSDERQAVSSTDEGVHVWALPPGRTAGEQPPVVEVADFARREVNHDSVAVAPHGPWILTGGWPNTMRLWDRNTRQLIGSFDEDGQQLWSVAFSPDGTRALSGGNDGVVRLWDLGSGEKREFRGHVDNVYCVAFSADGRRAYSAGGGTIRDSAKDGTDFAVRVWDLESGEQLRPLEGHKGKIRSVAVSPDGRYVLTGGHDAVPILWEARTGHEIHRFRGHTEKVRCVAFLPDGRRAVSAGEDRTIRLWDLESGREVLGHFKEPPGFIGQLAVSPDGRRLFSANTGGHELRYWNLETGELIQKLVWEANPMSGSFTPDGRHVVWGGLDGILRMYRLNDIPTRPIASPRRSPNPTRRSG